MDHKRKKKKSKKKVSKGNRPSSDKPKRSNFKRSSKDKRDDSGRKPSFRGGRKRETPTQNFIWHPTKDALDKQEQLFEQIKANDKLPKVRTPKHELILDPWQKDVYDNLIEGNSVIVDAPTTAGKTLAIERYFATRIEDPDFKAVYTTPIKSLANDKLLEFRELFGEDKIGIATGDIKENLDAPIIISTLECYRNSLIGTDTPLGRNIAVFDEYHFLQDVSRGSAWEEALVLSPETCQLLLLSASVANPFDFCDWLNKIKSKKCLLVSTSVRPVPLKDLVWTGKQWMIADVIPTKITSRFKKGDFVREMDPELLCEYLGEIQTMELTPTIVYSGKRLSTKLMSGYLTKVAKPLEQDQQDKIIKKIDEVMKEHQITIRLNQNLYQKIVRFGVAYHHSGLPISSRIIIESLLKSGLLQFCCSTTGLAVGVNFAVRSAVFTDMRRPSDKGLVFYDDSEILQMLGRAGRRGSDTVGFSLWPSLEAYGKLGGAKRDNCKSMLKIDPSTYLGLVGRGYGVEQLERFYSKSFLQHSQKNINFTLVKSKGIQEATGLKSLPCTDPAAAYAKYIRQHSEPCNSCEVKPGCHRHIKKQSKKKLSQMQIHLYMLGAIDENGNLTEFGEIAKYFPQNGGLFIANLIYKKAIDISNLKAICEVGAACSIAHFKEIASDQNYRFPFNLKWSEEELVSFYPEELFPNLYDAPRGRRDHSIIREFNPGAAALVNDWICGMKWVELQAKYCTEYFGPGDIMSLLTRVGTYLQSVKSVEKFAEDRRLIKDFKEELLREPMKSLLAI